MKQSEMRIFVLLYFLLILPSTVLAQDSVAIAASQKYERSSFMRKWFMGKNYRETWAMPVKMPVFNIHTIKGGMMIKELGGGQQTKSLRLIDKNKVEWVLRTVDKDVELALPRILRNTLAETVVQDMVSAAYPYAPLTVGELAKALRLNAPQPELFYVPDDTAFGEYRKIFAHAVCMLEKSEPTLGNTDAINTDEFLAKMEGQNEVRVNDTSLLKARLLDMLSADWDRHTEQWKWGVQKSGGFEVYYPIPRDRDQAFFYSDGLLVKIVRLFALKHMAGFTRSNKQLENLNRKAWEFDKLLLNRLDEATWKETIANFQLALNDRVLLSAVKKLPVEVYARDGQVILEKLTSRRNDLMEYGMKYYRFLSENIKLKGSNEAEEVHIDQSGDQLSINIFDKQTKKLLYHRKFNGDTRTIQMDMLGGNDELLVNKNVNSSTRLILDAGDGEDKVLIQGRIKLTADSQTRQEMKSSEAREAAL